MAFVLGFGEEEVEEEEAKEDEEGGGVEVRETWSKVNVLGLR